MNQAIRYLRIRCFEVRADGSIVKPAMRDEDGMENPEAPFAPPGPVSKALFDTPSGRRDRALLALLRGL